MAIRFAKQAECYGSDYRVNIGKKTAAWTITHCGIWDYRERAKQRGVKLTFDSPCTRYCTKLTLAMIKSKGYTATCELTESDHDHGCRWAITRKVLSEG